MSTVAFEKKQPPEHPPSRRQLISTPDGVSSVWDCVWPVAEAKHHLVLLLVSPGVELCAVCSRTASCEAWVSVSRREDGTVERNDDSADRG